MACALSFCLHVCCVLISLRCLPGLWSVVFDHVAWLTRVDTHVSRCMLFCSLFWFVWKPSLFAVSRHYQRHRGIDGEQSHFRAGISHFQHCWRRVQRCRWHSEQCGAFALPFLFRFFLSLSEFCFFRVHSTVSIILPALALFATRLAYFAC